MLLLGIFLGLVCLGVTFSFVPVLPGPPFTIFSLTVFRHETFNLDYLEFISRSYLILR